MDRDRALLQLAELKRLGKTMRLAAEGWQMEWQCLIATTMSAQSRDETTIPIAESLFVKYPTLVLLASAQYKDVLSIFSGLNYNKTKAKHVIACARMLISEFNGEVPREIDLLIKLPGVGRKTANVFLSEHGQIGLAVDTHVYQIARRLGWSRSSSPEGVEQDLKKLFSPNEWNEVNPILVRFGKTYTSRKEKEIILDELSTFR